MRKLGFGRGSILTFLISMGCLLVWRFLVMDGGFVSSLCWVVIFLTVPTGLTLAFIGALRGEEPRRFVIFGFVLNSLWLLSLLVLLLWLACL